MQEIGGQGVEQVGQDELPVARGGPAWWASASMVLAARPEKKAMAKLAPTTSCKWPMRMSGLANLCQEAGPVEGFDAVGHQQAERDGSQELGQRPDQGVPELIGGHGHEAIARRAAVVIPGCRAPQGAATACPLERVAEQRTPLERWP